VFTLRCGGSSAGRPGAKGRGGMAVEHGLLALHSGPRVGWGIPSFGKNPGCGVRCAGSSFSCRGEHWALVVLALCPGKHDVWATTPLGAKVAPQVVGAEWVCHVWPVARSRKVAYAYACS
jgi:hypothetical protein